MKKIYLMGLASFFALAATAQTTLKVNKPLHSSKSAVTSVVKSGKKGATAKIGGPNPSPMAVAANMVVSSTYTAGATQNIDMVLTLTNNDLEFGDQLEITFPAGIVINSTTNTPDLGPDDGDAYSDGPEAYNGITGQTISWGNNDDYYGGICSQNASGGPGNYPIQINITVPAGTTGNIVCTYSVSGDGYGATPADYSGTFNILDANAPNMFTRVVAVVTNTVTFATADLNNCSMGTHIIAAQINNASGLAQSNIPINYSVNGVASTVSTYTGTINSGDSAVVIFPLPYNFAPQGIYNIKAWTALSGDAAISNDTAYTSVVNSVPVALSSVTYTNGIQNAYEFASITQSWTGLGLGFSTGTHAHLGGSALTWTINNTTMGAPNGTYETMNILPCMDVTMGDTYRISYWKKASSAGTVTVNGQTGLFSGLTNDIASMTDVLKAYSALTPTSSTGPLGWAKDSADYVATANETRYFAIGGKGVLSAPNQQINIRLDDIKIMKIASGGVGIKNNTLSEVTMYPNPTTGILNINSTEANSAIEVFNVVGDKVYSNSLVKGTNSIDLSGLANGAYFVRLNANGQTTTKKVVISK